MGTRRSLAALLLFAGAPAVAQDAGQSAADIHGHIAFLAGDLLKGREAGSPEYDIAANYVASQMEQLGLKPGNGKSYFQHVPLVAYRPTGPGNLALVATDGQAAPLTFAKDYVARSTPLSSALKLAAPMVFVGFGITAPEHGRDDYKGGMCAARSQSFSMAHPRPTRPKSGPITPAAPPSWKPPPRVVPPGR